jgi:pyruvate ferredoxin oxidoreductase beta subunit
MGVNLSVRAARLAVETNLYPLYEIIDGRYVLSRRNPSPKPVGEYLKLQGRFKHLSAEDEARIQAEADRQYARLQWLASRP